MIPHTAPRHRGPQIEEVTCDLAAELQEQPQLTKLVKAAVGLARAAQNRAVSVWAFLTPWVKPGSLYHCGKSTSKSTNKYSRHEERGREPAGPKTMHFRAGY